MIQRLFAVLLVLVVFVGCGDDEPEKVKPKEEGPVRRIIWKKDGARMELIPAGSFEMVVHTIELDEFYMDVMEVTNAQYQVFMQQTGHRQPSYWNDNRFNQPNQPVVIDMRNSI